MSEDAPHILVAEDDRNLLAIIQLNLQAAGFQVTGARDGREAWELAQQGNFDLVLTDYGMPGVVGSDLCRRLRATDEYAETPLIMISALCRDLNLSDLQEELRLAAVLSKPFGMKEMVEAIKKHLARVEATASCP